jgi:hypothetical protein
VVRNPKAAKRPYAAPSFEVVDADTAKAELKANGESRDTDVQEMMSAIDRQLDGRTST